MRPVCYWSNFDMMSKRNRHAQKQYILTRNYWKSGIRTCSLLRKSRINLSKMTERNITNLSFDRDEEHTRRVLESVTGWSSSKVYFSIHTWIPFDRQMRRRPGLPELKSGLTSDHRRQVLWVTQILSRTYDTVTDTDPSGTCRIWSESDTTLEWLETLQTTLSHPQTSTFNPMKSLSLSPRSSHDVTQSGLFLPFLSTTRNCTSSVTESPDPNDRERNADSWPLVHRASSHTSVIVWTLDGTKSDSSSDSELSYYFSQVNLFLPSGSRLRRRPGSLVT